MCHAFQHCFATSGALPNGGLNFRLGMTKEMENKTFSQ